MPPGVSDDALDWLVQDMLRPWLLDGVAFGLLTIVTPRFLPAQVLVRGLAYDSLARRPLGGATIILQHLNRATITDSAGRFVLDSVPPGRHVVLLADSELDAIGLPTIVTWFEIQPGRVANVTVGVPSVVTLWRRVCGSENIGPDTGIVFGSVRDVDTDSLLNHLEVSFAWPVLQVTEAKQVRVERRFKSVWTDSAGVYRACGVGTEVSIQAQAGDEQSATGIVELMLAPRPIVRRDFLIYRNASVATESPGPLRTVRGQVLSDAGRRSPRQW